MEITNGFYFLGKTCIKGYLEQYRDGRYYCYRILISKKEYRCQELAQEMRFWDDGDVNEFVDELLDPSTFTPTERRALVDAIQNK